MLSSPSPLQLVLLGILLVLLLPCLCLRLIPQASPQASRPEATSARLRVLARMPLCLLLLMLSGCGTPRSPVFVSLPEIPAELMQGPQSPVLLGGRSPSTTLGTTRLTTPCAAASTAGATCN